MQSVAEEEGRERLEGWCEGICNGGGWVGKRIGDPEVERVRMRGRDRGFEDTVGLLLEYQSECEWTEEDCY